MKLLFPPIKVFTLSQSIKFYINSNLLKKGFIEANLVISDKDKSTTNINQLSLFNE